MSPEDKNIDLITHWLTGQIDDDAIRSGLATEGLSSEGAEAVEVRSGEGAGGREPALVERRLGQGQQALGEIRVIRGQGIGTNRRIAVRQRPML